MKDDEALRAGASPEETAGEETVGKDPAAERQTGAEEQTAPMTMSPTLADPSAASPKPSRPPRSAPSPELVALVYSAALQGIIENRLLRAGFNEADREDLKQSINQALLYMSNPPTDPEGCGRAANDITSKQIAGTRRKAYRRADVDAGLTDEADNHAQEDARELANGRHAQRIATVREAMTDGTITERDTQMLALKHEGLTDAQIGEKLGVAQQTVSNRIAMVRRKVRDKWTKRVTALTALTLAILLAVLAYRKREEVARFFHLESPAPAPAPAPTRPVPEPSIPVAAIQAGELRSEAIAACNSGDYATCSDRLEAAAKLDRAGDTDPLVRRLRREVEDHIRPEKHQVGAKPAVP
jgi:DNA-binding NarL/FixJ family response regulator